MSHPGKNFPGRNYSQVNILQSNLRSSHWLLILPNPPGVCLALVHLGRRRAKDAPSSLLCRQRLLSRLNTVNLRQANSHRHSEHLGLGMFPGKRGGKKVGVGVGKESKGTGIQDEAE